MRVLVVRSGWRSDDIVLPPLSGSMPGHSVVLLVVGFFFFFLRCLDFAGLYCQLIFLFATSFCFFFLSEVLGFRWSLLPAYLSVCHLFFFVVVVGGSLEPGGAGRSGAEG